MHSSTTRRNRIPAALIGAGALAVLLISACGSGTAESTEESAGSATSDDGAASADEATASGSGESDEASGEAAGEAPAWAAEAPDLDGELVVFAAASLNEVFSELGTTMEEQFPGLSVTFSFASSTTLAEQLVSGAPADILATANETAMTKAGDAVVDPVSFASNTLVIVTAPDNPQGITALADFANADLTLAVCAVEVPCGAASATAFEAGGITPSIDTYGENVTATLGLVTAGEVDAALVYATDAVSAGDAVATIEFPESGEAVNTNWIALAAQAPNPDAAAVFLALVSSEDGMAVLEAAGFGLTVTAANPAREDDSGVRRVGDGGRVGDPDRVGDVGRVEEVDVPRAGSGVPRAGSAGRGGPAGRGMPAGPPRAGGRERPPVALAVVGGLGLTFLALPLSALVLRAPWGDVLEIVTAPAALDALGLSLRTAASATAIALVLGLPLAWLLAHDSLPLAGLTRAVVTLPMVLPPVVGGIALLTLLGRRGLIGQYLEPWGITIPFTTLAVVLAQTFVAMPFLVLSIEGALRGVERRYEEVAATLGASGWYTFRRVTIPTVAQAVVAGAVLCFARALGEFGATITFAGNFPGTTQTMPIAIYLAREQDSASAVALALLLMLASALVLVVLRSRWLPGLRGRYE